MTTEKLQIADNLLDFYTNLCLVEGGLERGKNEDFYVDIFQEQREALRDSLLTDPIERRTYLISGQVGSGKSTFINFLPDDAIGEKYEIINIPLEKCMNLNSPEVNMMEVLLMIGFYMTNQHKKLEKDFGKEFRELIEIEGKRLEIEEIHRKYTLKNFVVEALEKFKVLSDAPFHRRIVRRVLKSTPEKVVSLINELFRRYNASLSDSNKKILLILDDLDKVREPDVLKNLFDEDFNFLENIEVRKIVSIPVHLSAVSDRFMPRDGNNFLLELKVDKGPTDEDEEINRNRDRLRQLLYKRVKPENDLISESELEKAIDFSGGIARQFIQILRVANQKARLAKAKKIEPEYLEKAIKERGREMSMRIFLNPPRIALLHRFLDSSHESERVKLIQDPEEAQNLISCMLINLIIVNSNGVMGSYVNPLIREAVTIYTGGNRG